MSRDICLYVFSLYVNNTSVVMPWLDIFSKAFLQWRANASRDVMSCLCFCKSSKTVFQSNFRPVTFYFCEKTSQFVLMLIFSLSRSIQLLYSFLGNFVFYFFTIETNMHVCMYISTSGSLCSDSISIIDG